ncbi:MAG: hypothetical protein WCW77_04685, partial [Patescibacteria group bacterium]
MLFFLALYYLIFAILSWQKPERGVMIIIFALPSYLIRFNLFGLPSTLLEGMILIAFFIWFIKNYREVFGNIKKRIKGKKIIGWVRYPFDLEIVL